MNTTYYSFVCYALLQHKKYYEKTGKQEIKLKVINHLKELLLNGKVEDVKYI